MRRLKEPEVRFTRLVATGMTNDEITAELGFNRLITRTRDQRK